MAAPIRVTSNESFEFKKIEQWEADKQVRYFYSKGFMIPLMGEKAETKKYPSPGARGQEFIVVLPVVRHGY